MSEGLLKIFIKDYKNVKDIKVRENYGIFAGIVGIICNLILFACKFFAGIITGSVSISADAFNNLSDAGSSIVTLAGFKMAGKPADTDHPFGHGRIEYIAGMIVSAVIIVMAIELFKDSVIKIFQPEAMEFSVVSVVILAGSIALKFWMAYFNTSLGKRIDSAAMRATAADSLSDCIATGVVLVSLLITTFTGVNIDGLAGTPGRLPRPVSSVSAGPTPRAACPCGAPKSPASATTRSASPSRVRAAPSSWIWP